jgi:hypothetical protein
MHTLWWYLYCHDLVVVWLERDVGFGLDTGFILHSLLTTLDYNLLCGILANSQLQSAVHYNTRTESSWSCPSSPRVPAPTVDVPLPELSPSNSHSNSWLTVLSLTSSCQLHCAHITVLDLSFSRLFSGALSDN